LEELEINKAITKTTKKEIDRLRQELETYKHAFETTAGDRDRLVILVEEWKSTVSSLLAVLGTEFRMETAPLKAPRTIAAKEVADVEGHSVGPNDQTEFAVPNTYCLGAPKSGTSFIYSVLREHPLVHVSPKDDGNLINLMIKGPEKYLSDYLLNCNDGYEQQPVFSNFEVGFMMHLEGPKLIKRTLAPNAKILFCLRDPVRRAVSEYKMRVRQYDPELGGFRETHDFFDAVKMEEQRWKARRYLYYNFYAYTERGKYAKYLQSYFDHFGKENIKVIILEDDIRDNSFNSLMGIFSFFSINDPDAIRISLSQHEGFERASKSPENIKVEYHLGDGSAADDSLPINEFLGRGVSQIDIQSDVPEQLSLTLSDPDASDVEAAHNLRDLHGINLTIDQEKSLYQEHFAGEITKLEELLKRDLSCWYARYAEI